MSSAMGAKGGNLYIALKIQICSDCIEKIQRFSMSWEFSDTERLERLSAELASYSLLCSRYLKSLALVALDNLVQSASSSS